MAISATRLYTHAEAAAVSGVGVKAVNNAIDKRIIRAARPARAKDGRNVPRALTEDDLLCLKLWSEVGDVLSQERRKRLFEAIRQQPDAKLVKADNLLFIDVAQARREIAERARALDAAEAMVVSDKAVLGGEAVFKGTRIPVRLIAAMLADGVEEAEILDGYPKLDQRALVLARIWVAAHPRRGRPRSLADKGFALKSTTRKKLQGKARGPKTSS
jgi:uncharacterized protein (DUF433 family)